MELKIKMCMKMKMKKILFLSVGILLLTICTPLHAEPVRIGLNYPQTGPYSVQGKAQFNGAQMALAEINEQGGILGRKIELVSRDSQSRPDIATTNVLDLIDREKCEMVFGGSSSAVAIAGGNAAKSKGKLYFGTLTYSNATTGRKGHKYIFRECYNSWMGAKAVGTYLRKTELSGRKFFYITADYTWGRTTEESIRTFSFTTNEKVHRRSYVPFPGATHKDFSNALAMAKVMKADVLVLVLFGKDMASVLTMVEEMGMKKKFKAIVVPNLTLGMATEAGPWVMEGIIGALPWSWNVPYKYNYPKGKTFVEKFSNIHHSYPSTSAASAYTILYQYKDAVERARTFDTKKVIAALEGHSFVSLKDGQQWRAFDHQAVQTVYTVRCKSAQEVQKDKYKQDYFEILDSMDGTEAVRNKQEWLRSREDAGKPAELEF